MIPNPGIYPGTPFDEYLSWEAANNSILRVIATKSPAHAKWRMDHPEEPTDAMKFGSALHTRVLEPDTFAARYIVVPKCDRRTKEGKATYAEFEEQAENRIILSAIDNGCIQNIAAEIEKHEVVKFVRGGASEVCIVWTDERTGVLCKGRLDYIHPQRGGMVDIKSTKDASPDDFSRSIWNYGYHQQFAFYADGWKALTGTELWCVIVACEKEPPFALAVYELHENIMHAGKVTWERALAVYAKCQETGEWPGYYAGPQILNLPKWALEKAGCGPHNLRMD